MNTPGYKQHISSQFNAELDSKSDQRTGVLVEYDATAKIFSNPSDERTENYITGRFG